MRLSRFWCGFLLAFSIMLIPLSFAYGDLERGYDALGGEVFTIALPYLIIKWRLWTVEQIKKSRQKKQRAKMQRQNELKYLY